jgi:hypothetical protein
LDKINCKISDAEWIVIGTVIVLCLVLMVGCSSKAKTLSDNSNSTNAIANTTKTNSSSTNNVTNTVSTNSSSGNSATISSGNNSSEAEQQTQYDSQRILLNSITTLAQQGKIINCDFPAKTTTIEDVMAKWGKADKSEGVPQAKGFYFTYSKYNVVFGTGKGDLIFEVRSFDSRLGQISLSTVNNILGNPAYNAKYNGQKIIGYTAGKEYKILFVFVQPTKDSNYYILDHYSVLYPEGTVNNMGNDPGRQW